MTANRWPTSTDAPSHDQETQPVAFAQLLALLGDEYACEIMRALDDGPMPARDLVEQCAMSRPTVYRRLERLTEAGVVDSELCLQADGHRRREFRLVCDAFEFQVSADGIDGSLQQPSR